MPQRYLIRSIYSVETDPHDWPMGLTNEAKEALVEIVRRVILDHKPLLTHELVDRVKYYARSDPRCKTFTDGVITDWIYGCVVRAARSANCEQRWHSS